MHDGKFDLTSLIVVLRLDLIALVNDHRASQPG
jgi:hypothetical protein